LLVATVNGKIIKLLWGYPIHLLEGIQLYATEARAALVNATLTRIAIEVDAPSPFPN
jgi:hypothetical protein